MQSARIPTAETAPRPTSAQRATPLPPGWYPLRALRALRALVANPDETQHVFTIIESLSGHAPLRVLARFEASESGRKLLAERADILPLLANRARLRAMPEGSLAHAYLAFLDREKISADGLVQASHDGETGNFERGAAFEYVGDRLRDTHDLWHAVTGYQGDVYGETALLAFSVAMTKNPGVALIVLASLVEARDPALVRLVVGAFRAGRRAEWLPAVAWEELLPLPLAEVRARLRIAPAPAYEPVRTSDLRATGQLAPA
jgi:ubiquinone biosynthesis protein COQ4